MDSISICNQSLAAIGTQSTIASLTENSTEALHCNLIYATTRDALLRKYRWGFTRAQIALTLSAAAAGTPENETGVPPLPPVPWLYEYLYPNDCLRAWYMPPFVATGTGISPPLTTAPSGASPLLGGPAVRFEVAQDKDAKGNAIKAILTNQEQAQLVYCRQTTDENLFDPDFVVALIGQLAKKLVIPLSGDKTLAKLAIEAGQAVEDTAAAADANESLIIQERQADWIRARSAGPPEWGAGYVSLGGFVYGPGADYWPE